MSHFANRTCIAVLVGSSLVVASAVGTLSAAVPPRSAAALFAEADVVVVAEVTDVAIDKQRSTIEKGFGNYDWAITCMLRIRAVEKGSVTVGDEIAAHCFEIHTRKSALEYLGLQGHSPIPETGQTVRAYLRRDGPGYSVLHPNGFEAADGGAILQAASVRSRGFTYLLPIELWTAALIIGVATWALVRMVRFIGARRSDGDISQKSS